MIPCSCPHCGRPIRADDRYAGRRVRCPQCKGIVSIPSPQPAVPDEAPVMLTFAEQPAPPTPPAPLAPPSLAPAQLVSLPPSPRPRPPARLMWPIVGCVVLAMCVAAGIWVIKGAGGEDRSKSRTTGTGPGAKSHIPGTPVVALSQPGDRGSAGRSDKVQTARLSPRPRAPKAPDGSIELPGWVDDVCAAGSGRYLVITCRSVKQILLFDAEQRRIVQTLAMPSENQRCAAGAGKMFIADADRWELQRWDLATFKLETSGPLPPWPQNGEIRHGLSLIPALAMGSAADGPLMLVTDRPHLIETTTLKPIDVKRPEPLHSEKAYGHWGFHSESEMILRASAEGATFAACHSRRVSPQSMWVFRLIGDRLAHNSYDHVTVGPIVPNFDGSRLCTAGGVFGENVVAAPDDPSSAALPHPVHGQQWLQDVNMYGQRPAPVFFLPGPRPALLIRVTPPDVPEDTRFGRPTIRGREPAPAAKRREFKMEVVTDLNSPALWTLPAVPELDARQNWSGSLTFDQRIHWFIDQSLLVTIPPTTPPDAKVRSGREYSRQPEEPDQPRLVMHGSEFSPGEPGAAGVFVDSTPPLVAERGKTWVYRMYGARVTATLQSGPAGMTLDSDGRLEWAVPADFAEPRAGVVLSAEGESTLGGRSGFHSFTIQVR